MALVGTAKRLCSGSVLELIMIAFSALVYIAFIYYDAPDAGTGSLPERVLWHWKGSADASGSAENTLLRFSVFCAAASALPRALKLLGRHALKGVFTSVTGRL